MLLINFLSSYLFIIPIIYSYYRNDVSVFFGSYAVLLTSILYHGTLNPIARTLDMTVSGICMSYFMFTRAAFTIWYGIASICVLSVVGIWNIKSHKKDEEASKWHSLLHAISCLGICCITN